jgi:hypothetical protein
MTKFQQKSGYSLNLTAPTFNMKLAVFKKVNGV